jgi:hypothetical protein
MDSENPKEKRQFGRSSRGWEKRNVISILKFDGVVPERGGILNQWSEYQPVRIGVRYGVGR